jgi:hypothetical protein
MLFELLWTGGGALTRYRGGRVRKDFRRSLRWAWADFLRARTLGFS